MLLSPRKLVGIGLYFIGIGFWVIVLVWLCTWAMLFLLPSLILAFFAGYLTNVLGRTSEWSGFKSFWLWETARTQYFNFKLYGNDEGLELMNRAMSDEGLEDEERVLWAIYPHGHYSMTAVFWWAVNPVFKKCRGAIHSAIFYVPVFGAIAGWIGAIGVTEKDMKETLVGGESIFMCPGGVKDIENTGNKVKRRRGFLRVAAETNTTVVPIWCPEERSYYKHWLPLGFSLERYLFFPIPMFIWGRWWCPIIPIRPKESRIYVGRPITFPMDLHDAENSFWTQIEDMQRQADYYSKQQQQEKEEEQRVLKFKDM